jgi:hypothetical protein
MRFFALNLLAAVGLLSGESLVAASDCMELSKPIWEETAGNSGFPYAEGMVTIVEQNVDEVVFSVSQLWNKAGVPMIAVNYLNENSENVCEMETETEGLIEYETSQTYTAECIMGFATIDVYAYVGDSTDFDAENCGACSTPTDDYVAYQLSLGCIPNCEEPIPDCFEEPLVVLSDVGHEEICYYAETPIMMETTGMNTDSVEFMITNTWPADIEELSVEYTTGDGSKTCDTFESMQGFVNSAPIQATCTDGYAEVSVSIVSGDINHVSEIVPETCACHAGRGSCTYEFVIPCVPDIDCDATPSPTAFPSESPSGTPTELPDTTPPPPVDCVDASNPLWKETSGSQAYPFDPNSIQILEQNMDDVMFSVSQILKEEGVPMFAVHYRTESGTDECAADIDEDSLIPFGTTETYTAECTDGYAEIAMYAFVGEGPLPADCMACTAPDENFVAYYVSLPCIPMCKPDVPDCLDEPLLVLADVEDEEMCIYDMNPLQADVSTMDGSSVEVTVENRWPVGMEEISISYTGSDGQSACQTRSLVDFKVTSPIQVYCQDGMASVMIHALSPEIRNVAQGIDDSCSNSDGRGSCFYEFVVPCTADAVCSTTPETDKPSSSPSEIPTSSPSSNPSSTPSVSPSSSPSSSPSRGPTASPSSSPSTSPSASPSRVPTSSPSDSPTASPTTSPSASPSGSFYPSSAPSDGPTKSSAPSASPSGSPSVSPSGSPSASPSSGPSGSPSASPSGSPSSSPSASPSGNPSSSPSSSPSRGPTSSPSGSPSASPSESPSSAPSGSPSGSPSSSPSGSPTSSPSSSPSASPSGSPSSTPTAYPTVSMEPTDCYMTTPPKVTEAICMSGGEMVTAIDMPHGTIQIDGQNVDSVEYTIQQQFGANAAGLAIKYTDSNLAESCDIHEDVALGSSFGYESQCIEGRTSVTVVLYRGCL